MAQVRTRKRGKTYSYIFEAGQVDGKRKVIEKGGFKTKESAYNAGVEAYTSFKHGNIGIVSEKIRLDDYLALWLKHMESCVKAGTIHDYDERIKVINKYIGHIMIQDLHSRDVDYLLQKLYQLGRSHNTIKSTKTVLGSALQYAIYPADLIRYNPARAVKAPANAPKKVIKRTIIPLDDFGQMLKTFPLGHKMHIPLMIAYHTGMRIGEILGLTWEKIDLQHGLMDISAQLQYIPHKGNFLTTPKTEHSIRQIMIDSTLIAELKRWKKLQAENELKYGGGYVYIYVDKNEFVSLQSKDFPAPSNSTRVNLVCTHENGKFVSKSNSLYYMRKLHLNAHSFRHTHATTLAENDANPKDVAARLGHADVGITQNLYTHVTEQMKKNTVDIIEKAINHADK